MNGVRAGMCSLMMKPKDLQATLNTDNPFLEACVFKIRHHAKYEPCNSKMERPMGLNINNFGPKGHFISGAPNQIPGGPHIKIGMDPMVETVGPGLPQADGANGSHGWAKPWALSSQAFARFPPHTPTPRCSIPGNAHVQQFACSALRLRRISDTAE